MKDRTKNALSLFFSGIIFQFPPFSWCKNAFYRNTFKFGSNCLVGHNTRFINLHKNDSAKIVVQNNVSIDQDVLVDYSGGVEIGEHVSIGPGVKIFTHNHEFTAETAWAKTTFGGLKIGKNAWIGANAVILPKVTSIGEATIIGAGAIVTKDIPAFSVAVGNPAKVIRTNKAEQL